LMRVRKARFQGAAVAAILLVSLAALMWLGAGKVLDRIKASSVADLSADRRVTMLKGAWHMFLDHPLLGTGLGTLVAVYPKYETFYDGRIVDHVHDDYAEALAETGIAGGLCGLVFLVMLFREARRRLLTEEQSAFSQAVHTAGTVACAGLLVHSLVDFNLHIPANGLVFLLQAAVVLSPTFNRRKRALIT
ncbi:MAG: O-antigen ligase family protein, partial [Candidatus Acidiferrales bacterium]